MRCFVKKVIAAAAAVVLSFTAGTASAHHIWLEPDGQGLRLCFGEFGENLRETSPGLLDKLEPKAKVLSSAGERPLTLSKSPACFAVTGDRAAVDTVVAEDVRYPMFDRKRDGKTTRGMWWPAARFAGSQDAAQPALTLDIVPAGPGKFQVFFKGAPLAKAKVEVVTPFGWSKEVRADDKGSFEVSLPWRGAYALEVQHTDQTAGKRGEEAYDSASYVTTLSLVQAQGLEMPPSPPAAKPN